MKIGIDAFVFQYPLTGIGTYTFELVKELFSGYPENEYRLLIDNETFSSPEIENFSSKAEFAILHSERNPANHGIYRYVNAIERRILAKIPGYNLFHSKFPFLNRKINDSTRDLDVYHAIDWYLYPSRHVKKNILTIFDLTTVLFPEFQEILCIRKEEIKKRLFDKFDIISAISESTKNDMVKYYSVKPEKISVVHLGADPIFDTSSYLSRQYLQQKYNIPENSRYILSVSTIEPRKNFMKALESFLAFSERNPAENFYLVCSGLWGWKNSELKKYLDSYPRSDRLIFTGYALKEDLPSLYHHSSAFLYLSLYEGFGLPILEAMKSGTPVICSNTSSMPEVIGEAGETVSPNNTEQIVSAMEKILLDEHCAKLLSEKGLVRSREFSWKKTAARMMELYKY